MRFEFECAVCGEYCMVYRSPSVADKPPRFCSQRCKGIQRVRTTREEMLGHRFGRLLVTEIIPEKKYSKAVVQCDCGKTKTVLCQSLKRGVTTSCGCYHSEIVSAGTQRSHGLAGRKGGKRSGTYNSWAGMMDRSEWGGHPSYANYGARGIRVCERWHKFENFLADMGERPANRSIDRIDGAGNYEPTNCRWATRREQALNTTRTVMVRYRGEVVPVAILCERLGLGAGAIRSRAVRRGNDYVAALASVGVECRAP